MWYSIDPRQHTSALSFTGATDGTMRNRSPRRVQPRLSYPIGDRPRPVRVNPGGILRQCFLPERPQQLPPLRSLFRPEAT